jgi:hypothetical protein
MARDFDGTGDNIDFGSDGSIDAFTQKTVAFWLDIDVLGNSDTMANKEASDVGWGYIMRSNGRSRYSHSWSTEQFAEWESSVALLSTGLHHVVATYDGASTSNVPDIYIDGTAATVSVLTAATGTLDSDAAATLRIGETIGGFGDYDGRQGFLTYGSTKWSASDVNRHRWWGVAPGGLSTIEIWQPMWTSSLVNKGTATGNGTAAGATMGSIPKVERMWGSSMGCGR